MFQGSRITHRIEFGKDLFVKYSRTFSCVLMVIVEILVDFGSLHLVFIPFLIQFILSHEIVNDGVALS